MTEVATACAQTSVWHSGALPSAEAWQTYREVISRAYLPWTPELHSGKAFSARLMTRPIKDCMIGEIKLSPLTAKRTLADISSSEAAGFYINLALTGSISVEHRGESVTLEPGDLVIMDSEAPITMQSHRDRNSTLTLFVPKDRFDDLKNTEDLLSTVHIPNAAILKPALHCLQYLAKSFQHATGAELGAVTNALLSLLPVASQGDAAMLAGIPPNSMLGKLTEFIHENISNNALSPAMAARHLEISERYVHKLFAQRGTTVMSYIGQVRLEQIRSEIANSSTRKIPISAIAFRWGYRDITTFSRAFKARFGRSPKTYRT